MAKTQDPEARVGETIAGKYRIERLLGAGGMGAVYAAVHEFTNRRVALKLMHEDFSRSKVAAERFLREARAPSAIGHPGIIEVLDGGQTDDGALYLVLELLEGETLAAAMNDQALPPRRVVALGLELLSALQAAHDAGFVHRDLKPENVFLAGEGKTARVKLLDFGIAGVLTQETDPNLTSAGSVLGTPLYMSPEQALGRRVDGRSDLWSLGAVLYQAVSGELPFGGDTVPALIVSISTQPHLPLSVLRPEVPRRLATVIERALQKNPEQRWPSAAAMAEALERALEPVRRSSPESPTSAVTVVAEPPAPPARTPEVVEATADTETRPVRGAALGTLLLLLGSLVAVGAARLMQPSDAASAAAAPDAAHAPAAAPAPAATPPPQAQAGATATATLAAPVPAEAAKPATAPAPTPPAAAPPPPSAAAPPEGLDPDQMGRVLREHEPELQRCYEQSVVKQLMQAGANQPDPSPLQLNVQLEVAASGRVRKATLHGSAPPELMRCLQDSLESWHFPASSGDTQAGFPIVFQPSVVRQ